MRKKEDVSVSSPVLSPVQVSLLNYVFLASWAFALPYSQYRPLASSICTVWTCVIIVCKMLYQLKSIDPPKPDCHMVNIMTRQFFHPCDVHYSQLVIIIKSHLKQTCSSYWATGTYLMYTQTHITHCTDCTEISQLAGCLTINTLKASLCFVRANNTYFLSTAKLHKCTEGWDEEFCPVCEFCGTSTLGGPEEGWWPAGLPQGEEWKHSSAERMKRKRSSVTNYPHSRVWLNWINNPAVFWGHSFTLRAACLIS